MKYLKIYEELNNQIRKGYYVIVDDDYHRYCSAYSETCKEIYEFISNNVGKLYRIQNVNTKNELYDIEYDNVPEKLKHAFKERYVNEEHNNFYITYTKSEIIFSSKNKEDAETFLQSKKYNL